MKEEREDGADGGMEDREEGQRIKIREGGGCGEWTEERRWRRWRMGERRR